MLAGSAVGTGCGIVDGGVDVIGRPIVQSSILFSVAGLSATASPHHIGPSAVIAHRVMPGLVGLAVS